MKKITKKQIAAIKYLLIKSTDASDFTKKICFLLLEKSNFLTKPVSISVLESTSGYTLKDADELWKGVHDMCSTGGTTHINPIMYASGSKFLFSVHCGHYDQDGKMDHGENSKKTSYTAWLSPIRYDHAAEKIAVTKKEVTSVALNSDLYN